MDWWNAKGMQTQSNVLQNMLSLIKNCSFFFLYNYNKLFNIFDGRGVNEEIEWNTEQEHNTQIEWGDKAYTYSLNWRTEV